MSNPIRQLVESGQSVWLDSIRRGMIVGGDFERMIERDGLRGVTSNPAIFEKAIAGSNDYARALESLVHGGVTHPGALYERLAVDDIRAAADLFRPVFDDTAAVDGYVSLEVSPRLAHDTEGTCAEARRLWVAVDRPNVMIKVPATAEGIPAVEQLVAEGININVTLLFSREVYREVAQAYRRGLERRLAAGLSVAGIASVASFFVSRIDSAVEKAVHARIEAGVSVGQADQLRRLVGRVAIANARLAYGVYQALVNDERWRRLASAGARPQRLLWASTGVKDPELPDTYYMEALIGPDTVTTVPPATYDAFRDHGQVARTLDRGMDEAASVMDAMEAAGIDMGRITEALLRQGVAQFEQAFDRLLQAVGERARHATLTGADSQSIKVPDPLREALDAALARWQEAGGTARLWARDPSLWTGGDEGRWLGWLCTTEEHEALAERLQGVLEPLKGRFAEVLLLGMGGSSLFPEVVASTFAAGHEGSRLHVLDSTVPAQIREVESSIALDQTLFVVSSKSGTTLEPNLFLDYFFERLSAVVGREVAGRQFIAITDPGSPLEHRAAELGFRDVFHGTPGIGGRYSALSSFGLVPAALAGLDPARLLDRADEMVQACSSCVPDSDNPAVVLGSALASLNEAGRDKLTLVLSPGIAVFGAWLEQLLAESTGKQGRAIIPVDGERLAAPEIYGDDRFFAYLRLADEVDEEQDDAVARLESAGCPVMRLHLRDCYDVGRELFRWEMATAVAGSLMGINPFDQPDVEAAKTAARSLMDDYQARGRLPEAQAFVAESEPIQLALITDDRNRQVLSAASSVDTVLRAHLDRLEGGDYLALLAYVPRDEAMYTPLQSLRHAVRDARGVATTLGYGPRYLHATGQAHKGGPDNAVFLQITTDQPEDIAVPGRGYGFATVQAAQAHGDLQVLAERGRRALRVHIGGPVAAGLAHLAERVEYILGISPREG